MLRTLYKVLKASGVRRGLGRVPGVEAFIERFIEPRLKEGKVEERMAELRRALHLGPRDEPVVAARPAEPEAPPPVVATEPQRTEVAVKPEPVEPTVTQVEPPVTAVPEAGSPAKAAVAPKGKKPKVKKSESLPAAKPAPKTRKPKDALTQLLGALEAHPKRASLLRAGSEKDQLLRSLIPLYLAQSLSVDVTSGTTTRFWAKQGVKYAAPNVAKALREHPGYSRRASTGPRITAAGVKYVEAALEREAVA